MSYHSHKNWPTNLDWRLTLDNSPKVERSRILQPKIAGWLDSDGARGERFYKSAEYNLNFGGNMASLNAVGSR